MSDEFASASMVRVLTQGLKELGLPPLEQQVTNAQKTQATVDLDLKLALVQHAIKHGGVDCLIHLGRGVHHHAHEPTHRAMVGARDPFELVVRWQRLERYIHSRHRLHIAGQGAKWMEITHDGVRAGIYPSLYESLVVFGVIAALLKARGFRDLEIHVGPLMVFPATPRTELEKLLAVDPSRNWRLSWGNCDETLTSAHAVSVAENLYSYSDWPQWQRQLVNHIIERLMDTPTIKGAAHHLNVSSRTLQRDLKLQGLSFSTLVGDCRARTAAMHLMVSNLPVAEVGFLCGYSDQSHFTREFVKRVGIPPQKYRVAFSTS
jgi:AraC-like DNA-binding protein